MQQKNREKKRQPSRAMDIFCTFLKFGFFTFGGGWSIIGQIQKEYVEKRGRITNDELLDYTSIGRSVPGLMIGNTSILFGYHSAGIPGAIAGLLGITIAPFLIMITVTFLYTAVKDNIWVARAMTGVRAAVVPIIISALMKLLKAGLKDFPCYVIAAAALALSFFAGVNNVLIVLLGAAAGLICMEVKTRHDLS